MGDAELALETATEVGVLPDDHPDHDGPAVSVVVITRDGLHHLRRLFDGLADRTAYRSFDVVVVDNDSSDGTRAFLEREDRFPLQVILNDENRSFSAANNAGIGAAAGELVLVCNNDVAPVHPDWLTRLVTPLRDDGVVATGPVLVYPERTPPPGEEFHHPDLTVQSAGIGFELWLGGVRGRNIAAGESPLSPALRGDREVAGITAACLLARREQLMSLGGFDERYFYGSEDWDLSLRLASYGRLVVVGASRCYHHEYATQNSFGADTRVEYRRQNHLVFNTRWGTQLRRRLLAEHLGASGTAIGDAPSTFALEPLDDELLHRMSAELEALGWQRSGLDDPRDPVLELTRPGASAGHGARSALSVCMVERRSAEERRRTVDPPARTSLVVGADGVRPTAVAHPVADVWIPGRRAGNGQPPDGAPARSLSDALRDHVARPRVAIRNCAPDRERGARWGDTYFAASFAAAFGRVGIEARQHTADQWEQPQAHCFDIVVHLRGIARYEPRPGPVNVLWIISHADDVTPEEVDSFDLALVASRQFADRLRERCRTPIQVFHQATDPLHFAPPNRDVARAARGVVVAQNARWPTRRAPRWLMDQGIEFELYGANWERFPEHRMVASDFVPNDELADIYASASIVVADQWDHMARDGFVANRLFDVAAAGGFCISDGGPGVRDVFGELVPVFDSADQLAELVRRYLDDEEERDRLSTSAMRLVRREHTFDVRVRELLTLLDLPSLTGPSAVPG